MVKIGAKFSGKLLVGRFWLIFQPACMLAPQTHFTSNPYLGKISCSYLQCTCEPNMFVFAQYLYRSVECILCICRQGENNPSACVANISGQRGFRAVL